VLKGSPFAIGIAPGLADAAKSTATVEAAGRSERRLEAGQELTVSIQLRDAFGNPTTTVGVFPTVLQSYCVSHISSWHAGTGEELTVSIQLQHAFGNPTTTVGASCNGTFGD